MANENSLMSGTKVGIIEASSHKKKEKDFEIKVCSSSIYRYMLVISDHLMHIVNRAIEYESDLVSMEVSIDFDSHTLEIFVCSDLSIKVGYTKITPINIFN